MGIWYNFNRQVINWSKYRGVFGVVDDQISVLIYSYGLALYSLKVLEVKKYGL